MLRIERMSRTDANPVTRCDTVLRVPAVRRVRASCAIAVLVAGSLFGMAVSAETPAPAAATPHAAAVPAAPGSKSAQPAARRVVSPYARAAAQHGRAGEPPAGHAPTMVQGMGKPHKPHAAPKK